jgi:hypothetical protein
MGLPSSFTQLYGTILVHSELLSCLFLRVDRNHRFLRRQRSGHALMDMAELRVPVGMIGTLICLAVRSIGMVGRSDA